MVAFKNQSIVWHLHTQITILSDLTAFNAAALCTRAQKFVEFVNFVIFLGVFTLFK